MSQDNNVTPIRPNTPPSFLQCFLLYFKITFFKASPDQLPYQLACLIKALLLYYAVNLFLLDAQSSAIEIIARILVELGLLALFLKIGFKITKKPERFLQTFSALIGVNLSISLISVPIYYLFIPEFMQNHEVTQSAINITIILLIWNLAVISHIFKRCFEISTLMSATFAFNYLIAFEVMMVTLSTGAS